VKNAGKPTLYSMDGQIYDKNFPKVIESLSQISQKDLVLDGELVALEPSGRPRISSTLSSFNQ